MITILLSFLAGLAVGLPVYAAWGYKSRQELLRAKAKACEERDEFRDRRNEAWADRTQAERKATRLEGALKIVLAERDEFERVAKTHEVKLPKAETKKIVEELTFRGSVEDNLARLQEALETYSSTPLTVNFTINPLSFKVWTTILQSYRKETGPGDSWELHGFKNTGALIFQDIRARCEALFRVRGRWASKKPISFGIKVTYEKTEAPAKLPEVHTVEVLRTKTVPDIRVVEVPKPARLPDELRLCMHSEREIVGYIDAILKLREEEKRLITEAQEEPLRDPGVPDNPKETV